MNLEQTVSRIVRQSIEDFLLNQSQLPEQAQKKVLVLMVNNQYESEITKAVQAIPTDYNVIFAHHKDLINQSRSEWEELICEMDLIAVPVLTIGTLVKISNLIDDEPVSAIVMRALLKGKHVIVSTKHVIPSGFEKVTVPPEILDKVSEHFQTIRKYGVQVTSWERFPQLIHDLLSSKSDGRRPLIHANHVRDWIYEGETRISIPKNAIITSLAKEEAKALGLSWDIGKAVKEESE